MFLGSFVDWMDARGYVGRAQWDPAFYIYAGVLMVGGVLLAGRRRGAKNPDEEPAG